MTRRQGQAPTAAGTQGGLVLLLGALTMFGPLSIDLYLPALPEIGRVLQVSETQSSVAAFLAGMAVGQGVYGPASDRMGRRPPVLVGILIYVAASVLCAVAPHYGLLAAGRFLQGLGACAGGVVARAIVRDRFSHSETARVLSLMTMVSGLAPVVAPLAGGLMLQLAGWRSLFWVLALFGLMNLTLAYLRLPETRSEHTALQARSESPFRAYASLLSNRRLVGYALAGALNGAMLFTYISASPALLISHYQIPQAHFGWVFSINALGFIAAGQLNRRLLRRMTPDRVLSVSTWIAVGIAVVLATMVFTGTEQRWAVLVLLFCLLSTYGLLQGNTLAGALSVDPSRAGSTSALQGTSSFATGALASFVTGLFADGTARPLAVTLLVASIGAALAIRYLSRPPLHPLVQTEAL
jgi:DHA1 family bicyclomycin/chloramphenicol resistance-like MFS transporter